MSGEFVANYVQGCIQDGIQMPAEIRKKAELEISRINNEVQKIESLRVKQRNLRAVIRHLGGSIAQKTSTKTQDFTMAWDQLDTSYQNVCIDICNLIKKNGEMLPGAIRDVLGYEQKPIYSAIQWLDYNEIIARKDIDDGRAVVKGNSWDAFMAKLV